MHTSSFLDQKTFFSGLWLRGAARTSRQNSSDKQNSDYRLGPGKTEILLILKRIREEIVPLERHLFTKCYSELMTSRVSRIWLLRFYPSSDGWSFQRSWGSWTFTVQKIDDQQTLTNNKLDSYCNTSNSDNDEGCGRIQTGVCAASRCFKWAKHFHVLYIYSVNTQVPSYLMVSGPLSGCL